MDAPAAPTLTPRTDAEYIVNVIDATSAPGTQWGTGWILLAPGGSSVILAKWGDALNNRWVISINRYGASALTITHVWRTGCEA